MFNLIRNHLDPSPSNQPTIPSPPPTTTTSTTLPSITLLVTDAAYITAFHAAAQTHALPPTLRITPSHHLFNALPAGTSFDAVVSPANSYGQMDGGFDDALSRAFSPASDYLALTRVVKRALYAAHRGFLAPGGCVLVGLEAAKGELRPNPWGCRYLAVLPTMKVPQNVGWDREVVYEGVWALCAAVEGHNRRVGGGEGGEGSVIREVLMTPLATGCGLVSKERWAAQTVLALKHFVSAVEMGEEAWVGMDWVGLGGWHAEVEGTYGM